MEEKYANGQRKVKIPQTKTLDSNTYLKELLSHDVQQMFIEKNPEIEQITGVFKMKKIIKSERIPVVENITGIIDILREANQGIIGTTIAAVGMLTSLVSIFTTNELMNMSSSEDIEDDLIDNNNNIVRTLQSHENAMNRREKQRKGLNTL